jgi:hypothetical protein
VAGRRATRNAQRKQRERESTSIRQHVAVVSDEGERISKQPAYDLDAHVHDDESQRQPETSCVGVV